MSTIHQDLPAASVGPPIGGRLRLIILVLFFLSGACGLIYEVVWMRMLTLVFGATAFATSTILASFFTGLALGSFHFGRAIDKGGNPLRVYALLEVGIGAFAFLMPVLLSGLSSLYVGVSRLFDLGFYELTLLRFVLSFLVMLIPATLMGGTLPVIVKLLVQRRDRLAWNVGQLYSVNTFGAVIGTVLAGFFFILILGVKETAYVAGAVNLLIAATVFAMAWRLGTPGQVETDPTPSDLEQTEDLGRIFSASEARLALWAVGLSGLCALALEVLWTRALVFFLDNTTHAFTTILTAFLLGIAIGSFVIGKFIDTRTKLLGWLGSIEILIGLLAILAIPILNNLTPVLERIASTSRDSMLYWKWTGMRFVTTFTIMLLPTVLMGMTFPLVSKIYARSVSRVGTALGHVYSVNTIGGVIGSVTAGFALVPFIGVQNGIILIGAISVGIGIVVVLSDSLMTPARRWVTICLLGIPFIVLGTSYLTTDAITLTSYTEKRESVEVLSYEEGIGATVKVFHDGDGETVLSIDGFPVAGTSLVFRDTQKALGHLPLLLSTVPSPRVNIVGFGAGGTSWAVTRHDVGGVDCVELVPGVLRAAEWFPEINHDVLSHPDFNLILGDGRNHALVSEETYDVISIDATSPKMAGNGSLYALEFYESLRNRLSEDGLVVQWLPLHLLSDGEIRMTAKTFLTVFPHTTFWLTPFRQYGILVATQRELEIDLEALRAKMEPGIIREELEDLHVFQPVDFLDWFAMGEEALSRYVEDARINSDNHPYLEFSPGMFYFLSTEFQIQNTLNIRESRESVLPFLVNMGKTDEEVRAVAAEVQERYQETQERIVEDIRLWLSRFREG